MRKIFLTVVLAAICSASLMAQNSYSSIVHRFAHEEGVECVNVGSFLMGLCHLFMDDDDEADFVKGISSVSVIDASDCSESVKSDFRAAISDIDQKDMELLMEMCDDSDILKIFVKQKGDYFSQFLLVNTGDEPCMVNIGGKINKRDLDKLVAQNK